MKQIYEFKSQFHLFEHTNAFIHIACAFYRGFVHSTADLRILPRLFRIMVFHSSCAKCFMDSCGVETAESRLHWPDLVEILIWVEFFCKTDLWQIQNETESACQFRSQGRMRKLCTLKINLIIHADWVEANEGVIS